MTQTESNPGKFHITLSSVMAGFLLFGGLKSLITICQEPLTRAIAGLLNRFLHSNALKIREAPTNWVFIFGNLAFGLIFIVAAIIIGARVLRNKTDAPSLATD